MSCCGIDELSSYTSGGRQRLNLLVSGVIYSKNVHVEREHSDRIGQEML